MYNALYCEVKKQNHTFRKIFNINFYNSSVLLKFMSELHNYIKYRLFELFKGKKQKNLGKYSFLDYF